MVGFYKVKDKYIGEENLKIGDIILEINDIEINTINELTDNIKKFNYSENINLLIKRENKKIKVKLNLVYEDNTYKTGLYLKDSIAGIGTLTYIDPISGIYGALGHEVLESNTRKMIEVKNGNIFDSVVTGINKSSNGSPGSKNTTILYKNKIGDVKSNTIRGLFGIYNDEFPKKKQLEIADFNDIKNETAYIYTNNSGKLIKKYKINILNHDFSKINTSKSLNFEIIDDKLLNETGGIVQGMSGSPIIQNNKIIGAVTHVIVNEVKKGYGIYIKTMLKEGEK